jgi:hypothetical protein
MDGWMDGWMEEWMDGLYLRVMTAAILAVWIAHIAGIRVVVLLIVPKCHRHFR